MTTRRARQTSNRGAEGHVRGTPVFRTAAAPAHPAIPQPPRFGLRASTPRANRQLGAGGVRGFTLLEVVLALSIAFGLLVVVLYYYQQAALLRDSTLRSAAGLAAVRLCMDRLATELRTASAQPDTFRGGPQDLEFLQCGLPEPGTGSPTGSSLVAATTFLLRRIRYALPDAAGEPGGQALARTETSVAVAAPATQVAEAPSPSLPSDEPPDTNQVMAVESVVSGDEDTRVTTSFPSAGAAALTVPEVRYLHLRYWDGAAWQESWSAPTLPRGVEITLALDAVPAEATADTLPGEVFRRVIAIPGGSTTSPIAAPEDPFDAARPGNRTASEDGL
jgi:type II secretory pathway pseudopilin PulG